jgi:predicted signal transduction protein with EAL and GGDEF domain
MREEAMPYAASPLCDHVTLSIGVASLPPDTNFDVGLMLNAADCAMYRAKFEGRACYKIAEQTDWKIIKNTSRIVSFAESQVQPEFIQRTHRP